MVIIVAGENVLELIVGWKRRCKWQMMVAVVVHMTGGVTCEE